MGDDRSGLRTAAMLLGAVFVLQGVGWLVVPERAAAMLGMPALDGLARSTQFGDFAAFFLFLGGSILMGTRPGRAGSLVFPAALLGGAAVCRTLAWAIHGAAFAAAFILVEVAGSILLFRVAQQPENRM